MSEPKVGDYIVVWSSYTWDVIGPLTRVTKERVWFSRWTREGYISLDNVRFYGPSKESHDLKSVLRGLEVEKRRKISEAAEVYSRRRYEACEKACASLEVKP